jgi:acetylglutamate kinase
MDENDDESLIAQLDRATFRQYAEQGLIRGGMIPKLENAFKAIDAGVKQVLITNASEIHSGVGTYIY